MKLRLSLWFFLVCGLTLAFAQDITNHAVPIGGGPGAVGWKTGGPCSAGQALVWASTSADPTCISVSGSGSTPGGSNLQVQYNNGGTFGGYTNTQLTALINPATASLSGAIPAWPNDTTKFFRSDGTYAVPPSNTNFNFLFNANFEFWDTYTGDPTCSSGCLVGWGLSSPGSTSTMAPVTSASTVKWGSYAAQIVQTSNTATINQGINSIPQFGGPASQPDPWFGKTTTFGCWTRTSAASNIRLAISDGVGTTFGSYHTGSATYEFITVSRTISGSATGIIPSILFDNTSGTLTSQIDACSFVQGSTVTDWIPFGWDQIARRGTFPVMSTLGTNPTAGSTNYMLSGGHTSSTTFGMPMPFKGMILNAYFRPSAAPGGSETYTYTMMANNGALPGVTCTITGAATACNSGVGLFEIAAGDYIAARVVLSGSAAVNAHAGTFTYIERP